MLHHEELLVFVFSIVAVITNRIIEQFPIFLANRFSDSIAAVSRSFDAKLQFAPWSGC
jgi:hypothetical protein